MSAITSAALMRFGNLIGFTRMAANPDSWEGWYWGAMHHYGNSMRVGVAGNYGGRRGLSEGSRDDRLLVERSGEHQRRLHAGFEGTQRRLWAKELGIEFVHIDPHFNADGAAVRRPLDSDPAADRRRAGASRSCMSGSREDLYDKDYVAQRTTGFEEWRAYLLGDDGRRAQDARMAGGGDRRAGEGRARARAPVGAQEDLPRRRHRRAPGFGGACRGATGAQWARCMVMMMAMQGLGQARRQHRQPADAARRSIHYFYFPGYADGGISGELQWNGNAVNNYQRMPHVLTMNPVRQLVPRQQFPDAIIEGEATRLSVGRHGARRCSSRPSAIRCPAIRRST